ncbi:uncharacterized protein BDV17DRAFT_84200 [Aspergillus undulatus]|uniref:uncharacterized protein n=1 Tax=Aspergillus undulatus TaxID=1810928 RepID=UPI003CCE3507
MWSCNNCSAVFHRLDHFKRHVGTHRTDNSSICGFWASAVLYTSADVLRRHWRSRSVRIQTGKSIPRSRLGGNAKHACDSCARQKRSCSDGQPCRGCHSRAGLCSYERL